MPVQQKAPEVPTPEEQIAILGEVIGAEAKTMEEATAELLAAALDEPDADARKQNVRSLLDKTVRSVGGKLVARRATRSAPYEG